MPFNELLWTALLPGKTKAEENGVGVNLDRGNDETVLLFHLDSHETKKALGLGNVKLCDYMYLFKRKGEDCVLIFVELKHTNVDGADEQFLSAYTNIVDKLPKCWKNRIKALLVSSGSTPADTKKIIKKLSQKNIRFASIRSNTGFSEIKHIKNFL